MPMGVDEEAVNAINEGPVLLQEMPRELLEDGPAAQRAAWVEEQLTAWRKRRARLEPGLGEEVK